MSRFLGGPDAPFDAQDPEVCVWLRDRFRIALNLSVSGLRRKIIISRSLATSRRILNEQELVRTLECDGFELHCLERMTFEEQARLFSSASHIVAAHGSGLTNLLFANDVRVCELFSKGHGVRSEYFQISAALGHQYNCMIVDDVNDQHDICVDVDQVRSIMCSASCLGS
jgi:capsular polysaccharide biosynthesis protein